MRLTLTKQNEPMSLISSSSLPSGMPERPFPRVRRYAQIMHALMMHDIKNRYFGSGLGQIVMVLWPFAHIAILLIVYIVTKRPHPYRDSLLQYSAVSVFPFICFNYVSRWICYSASQNKSFLGYPILKPLDILISRTLLEVVSITLVAFLLMATVACAGDSVYPADPLQALWAVMATTFVAIGFGFVNAAFAFIIPLWVLIITLFIILAYVSSGILFLPASLPEPYRTYLSYNPLLQCTEWLRSAYFADYPTFLIDRVYVIGFGLGCLTLGVVLVNLLRRYY